MIEGFLSFALNHAFELASLLISAGALVYAALALNAARQALSLSKNSEVAASTLKGHDAASIAERSFLKLQQDCRVARGQWEQHIQKHYPALSPDLRQPKEIRRIFEIENRGRVLLQDFKNAKYTVNGVNAAELESFVQRAHFTAMEIERLNFDIEAPKPFIR